MIASQISLERLQRILEHYIVLNNGKEYDDSALQKMKSAVDKMEAIKQIITELRLCHKDLKRLQMRSKIFYTCKPAMVSQ